MGGIIFTICGEKYKIKGPPFGVNAVQAQLIRCLSNVVY